MSFTLQREKRGELVQNSVDLNDRLTGWRFNVQPGRELTLTLGLARSICIKSPTVRRFVCDSALTWISVPSLVIFSYILFLFFFLFYFCRRRSHQYLLLFINSFTNDTFYACLNSKTNSDFDWGDSWALCLLFFFGGTSHLHFHTSYFAQSLLFFLKPQHLHGYPAHLLRWFNGHRCLRVCWLVICVNFLVFEHSVLWVAICITFSNAEWVLFSIHWVPWESLHLLN